MAEDDKDRTREREAEREAEIKSEVERVDRNPDDVQEGNDSLGTQSADSGAPRREDDLTEEGGEEGTDADGDE